MNIKWDKAPSAKAVWCEALDQSHAECSGWHEKTEEGDYRPVGPDHVNHAPWIGSNEGVLFSVHHRPGEGGAA